MNDEDPKRAPAPARSRGGFMKVLLATLGGGALLAVGGYAGSRLADKPAAPETQAAAADEPAPSDKPALYASLQPALVVNFRDSRGDSHYMQVLLEVMSRDPDVIDAVKQHSAVIRNGLILLFSGSVDYAVLNTREHKEKLLADALAEVRRIVHERTGSDGVEAVYFTSLIVQ